MPETRTCSSCGAALPADAPAALCALCASAVRLEVSATGPGGTAALPLPSNEQVVDRIGHYRLLQEIGTGAFGVVYLAEQSQPVRRRVALKIIKLGMDTKEVIGRFEAERQALALMDHPNIAKVFDAGTTAGGRPYFVMELVKGERITDYCDRHSLTTRERLNLFVQICHAIQHAHQKGIIHRDIKPSNILISMQDGVPVPKVIDFGIAKATEQRLTDKTFFTARGDFVGTPAYMSPEQADMSGVDIDTRSDIYSLGVLFYELLTGKTPFDAKQLLSRGIEEMRRAIREEEPRRPSTRLTIMDKVELTAAARRRQIDSFKLVHLVRGDLDWIVMKCLEKDRTRRYETANGLALDIVRHINNDPVLARPPSQAYRFQKAWRRHKTAFVGATLMAAVLVAATAISVWQALLAKQRQTESDAIAKFLTEAFQSPDPALDGRTITVAETLNAAARKLETDLASQPARRAKLQATLGMTYYALGLDPEAIALQEKVRDYYAAASGPEDPATLLAMQALADTYADAGLRDDALKLREEVLRVRRKTLGPENPDTLWAMQGLADSYTRASRPGEALKLREQVLELRRKTLGPEHPDTLWAMQALADSYADAGRRDEALKLREEVLTLRRKVIGPEHPDTVWAMQGLADSYADAGRADEALKLREQALELRRKTSGPEHPDTLWAMNNLAISLFDAGRRDEALKLREQVLELRRKKLGPKHPDTLSAMDNLAISYDDAGRRDEALKLRQDELALRRKISGPEHPDTLEAMNNLAISYGAAGRWDEAVKLREEVLGLRRKTRGPEHPDTLWAMQALADSYADAGRAEDALKSREQLLTLRCKVLGAEDPATLWAMQGLADSYAEAGRRDEALKLRERTLALRLKVLGPEHPDTLWSMNNVAISYDAAGRREEALRLREQVLELRRKVIGPQHPDTLQAMKDLAYSYCSAGRGPEAIGLLRDACQADPKDTDASLTLAVWQTWFGQDADYEATRRRLVQQAEGTSQAGTAERAAKAACVRPSTDAILLTNALQLARRAVQLGQGSPSLPWYQLTLGLAQYRNGLYADAERSVTLTEQTVGDHDEIQGIAHMFHAMTLFRQNRPAAARKLFLTAAAQVPPLPQDESKPIVDGRPLSHDLLMWWLAYKEARSLNEAAKS